MSAKEWGDAESGFLDSVGRVVKESTDERRDRYQLRNAIYGALSSDIPPPNPDTDVLWVSMHTGDPFRAYERREPYVGDAYTRMPVVRGRREVLFLEVPPGQYTHVGLWTDRIGGNLVDRWSYPIGSDWSRLMARVDLSAAISAAYFDVLTEIEYDGTSHDPDLDIPIQGGPPDGIVGLHLLDAERFIKLRGLDPNTRVIVRPADIDREWRFDGEVIFTDKAQRLSSHVLELRNIIQQRQEQGL